jgi:peptidoglycan/LPS O-acetylase OafA/YrhL
MAWHGKSVEPTDASKGRLPWISIGLLFLATWQFNALFRILDFFGYGWVKHSQVSFVNLDVFPLGLIILAGATSRRVPWPRFWWSMAIAQPAGMVLWSAFTRHGGFLAADALGVGSIMTLLGLLLLPWRLSNDWLKALFPVGLISYGIYIFQWPAIHFVHGCFSDYSGTLFTYLVRFCAVVFLTFLISYLGERLFQPWVRRVLNRYFASRTRPEKAATPVAQPAP